MLERLPRIRVFRSERVFKVRTVEWGDSPLATFLGFFADISGKTFEVEWVFRGHGW